MCKISVDLDVDKLRIRIASPGLCASGSFRTQDFGQSGRLHRIACRSKRSKKFFTQSWVMILEDYSGREDAISELRSIKGLSNSQISRGSGIIKKWFSMK